MNHSYWLSKFIYINFISIYLDKSLEVLILVLNFYANIIDKKLLRGIV